MVGLGRNFLISRSTSGESPFERDVKRDWSSSCSSTGVYGAKWTVSTFVDDRKPFDDEDVSVCVFAMPMRRRVGRKESVSVKIDDSDCSLGAIWSSSSRMRILKAICSEKNGAQDEGHLYHFTFKASSIDLTASLPFNFFPTLFRDVSASSSRILSHNESRVLRAIQLMEMTLRSVELSAESCRIRVLMSAVFPVPGAPEMNMLDRILSWFIAVPSMKGARKLSMVARSLSRPEMRI